MFQHQRVRYYDDMHTRVRKYEKENFLKHRAKALLLLVRLAFEGGTDGLLEDLSHTRSVFS